jgi:hypothetical protein
VNEGTVGHRMRRISDFAGADLIWLERGRPGWLKGSWHLGSEHELRLHGEIVARLRFQSGWPSDAEVNDHRWTFELVRTVRTVPGSLAVRDEETKDIAFFHWRSRGGTLDFGDGRQLVLERWPNPIWRPAWSWQDAAMEVIHFKERRWQTGMAFDIRPTAAHSHEMPLLVVMGWYRILREWEAKRTPND